jgi:UDP-glucose 4-epimerase
MHVGTCPLTGSRPDALQPILERGDLRDPSQLNAVFAKYSDRGGIWAVVHLAALKAVGESGEIPIEYYKVNVGGSLSLLEVSTCTRRG